MKELYGIEKGIPYCRDKNQDNALFTDLSKEEQVICTNWVQEKIVPRKTTNWNHTSFSIKRCLRDDTEIYITNNQFKHLMLLCGYKPDNVQDLCWCFNISEKSPCFSQTV